MSVEFARIRSPATDTQATPHSIVGSPGAVRVLSPVNGAGGRVPRMLPTLSIVSTTYTPAPDCAPDTAHILARTHSYKYFVLRVITRTTIVVL